MAIEPLTEYIEHDQPGSDETGLGRWSVMAFKGYSGRMWVICGYNPCYNKNPESSTTYQQHRRFFFDPEEGPHMPQNKV